MPVSAVAELLTAFVLFLRLWMSGWLMAFVCFHNKNAIHPTCPKVCMQNRSCLEAIPRETSAQVTQSGQLGWYVHGVLLFHDLWHLHLRLLVLPDVLKGPWKMSNMICLMMSYDVQVSGASSRNPKPWYRSHHMATCLTWHSIDGLWSGGSPAIESVSSGQPSVPGVFPSQCSHGKKSVNLQQRLGIDQQCGLIFAYGTVACILRFSLLSFGIFVVNILSHCPLFQTVACFAKIILKPKVSDCLAALTSFPKQLSQEFLSGHPPEKPLDVMVRV